MLPRIPLANRCCILHIARTALSWRFMKTLPLINVDAPCRRHVLRQGANLLLLALLPTGARALTAPLAGNKPLPYINTLAVRLWPAEDYTRVTLEFSQAVHFRYRLFENPHRLVVDIDDVRLDSTRAAIGKVVVGNEPYLQAFRVGQFTPNTLRLVFDLKQAVRPQVFSAEPVGPYRYRFFIDLHPLEEPDPLLTLLQLHQDGLDALADAPDLAPVQAAKAKTQSAKINPRKPEAPMIKKSAPKLVVVLDPWHGGEDPGAVGAMGTYEKTIVLEIAQRTKLQLESMGMQVALTRDRDYFIPLSKRVDKARRVRADLFISIHADAFTRRDANGSSIFVVSDKGASSQAARWLASKENSADRMGGVLQHRDATVASTLLDLTQSHTRLQSDRLANHVLGELSKINTLHKKQVEYANFAVLKAPDIPSALIETAFISNPIEERRLRNADYQDSLARAIARGVVFFRQSMLG